MNKTKYIHKKDSYGIHSIPWFVFDDLSAALVELRDEVNDVSLLCQGLVVKNDRKALRYWHGDVEDDDPCSEARRCLDRKGKVAHDVSCQAIQING